MNKKSQAWIATIFQYWYVALVLILLLPVFYQLIDELNKDWKEKYNQCEADRAKLQEETGILKDRVSGLEDDIESRDKEIKEKEDLLQDCNDALNKTQEKLIEFQEKEKIIPYFIIFGVPINSAFLSVFVFIVLFVVNISVQFVIELRDEDLDERVKEIIQISSLLEQLFKTLQQFILLIMLLFAVTKMLS